MLHEHRSVYELHCILVSLNAVVTIFPKYKLLALAWQYDVYSLLCLNFMGIKPQVEHKTVSIAVGMAYQHFVMEKL